VEVVWAEHLKPMHINNTAGRAGCYSLGLNFDVHHGHLVCHLILIINYKQNIPDVMLHSYTPL